MVAREVEAPARRPGAARTVRGALAGLAVAGGAGLAHGVAEAARLLLRHAQGWTLSELLPELMVEAALAAVLLALLLVPVAAAGLRRAAWGLALALVVGMQLGAWFLVPAEPGAPPPLGASAAAAGVPDGRTVVLITTDTLRRDHVSAYPEAVAPDLTPHIDALAAEGTLFLDAVTTAPLTLPSHTTLLSGVHPVDHGVVKNGRALPADLDAVPAELGRVGFRTGAFTSSLVLHGGQGLRRWFQVYRDALGARPARRHLLVQRLGGELWRASWGVTPDRLGKERGDRTVARALAWLDTVGPDEPVFLWVHLYDAHLPHEAHPGVADGGTRAALPHPCDYSAHPVALRRSARNPIRPDRAPLPPEAACRRRSWADLDDRVASYAGEVRFLDAQVGALIDGLKARGRWDDAAVLLVADHGESLVEHQHHVSHQYALYDPVVRVPLVVRVPGGAPSTIAAPVSTVRVAATLRALAGLPEDPEIAGPPLLAEGDRAGDGKGELALAVGPAPVDRAAVDGALPLAAMVRDGSHKVLRDETGHVERYDLGGDPLERTPLLSADEQEAVDEAVRRWLAGPVLPPALRPMAALRGRPEDVDEALAQDGVRGQRADEAELARFAEADAAVRAALDRWRSGQREEAGEAPELPEEVREGLEALGYLQ